MTKSSTPPQSFPRHRLYKDAGYAMMLNLIIALSITLVAGGKHFFENLVVSTCIGGVAFLLIDGARLAIWGHGQGRVKWVPFFGILMVAAPIAQIVGRKLAGIVLNDDLTQLELFSSIDGARWMAFTLLAASCTAGIYAIRERMRRAESDAALEKARAEQVERQALQAQLQLLQAQIEPHMLFNTLANLQGMIAIDPPRAQAMLDQLIVYLRATLSSSRAKDTTLGQEFALMDAYLGLMSVRMGARLGFTLNLPDALRSTSVPPMLLQPLVENAIIHGLEPKIDGGHITVSAALDGDALVICVADTGLGLDSGSSRSGGTRLGVANTRERLQALHGEQASLSLEANTPNGALARLTLPRTTA